MTLAQPSQSVAASARWRTARAEAIKEAWRVGGRPDAAAALAENPDIAADRAIALDLAYEEFCVREEAGEHLDPVAFCTPFPFGASLCRLLTIHQFLDDHPDALGGAPTNWPAAGEVVDDFHLLRELGRGSFSRVYLAVEASAGDRPVALKVSAAGSREADTLSPLSHPHLIPVLSSRASGPWTVVAMPFAGTATLEDVLSAAWAPTRTLRRSGATVLDAAARGGQPDDPPFPARPAFAVRAEMTYEDALIAVAAALFEGIAYLHERGIVHRDLKPSNVLLGPNGHPYLLDFNLASRAADPWRMAGTLPYMAPEQLAVLARPGAAVPTDGRPGDVFAGGVVLFELLTGRHPFGGPGVLPSNVGRDQAADAILAAQRAGHPDLAALNPKVRRTIRTVVARCLALDPRARPTAAELVELFSASPPRRRGRSAVPVLASTGLLTLALSYSSLWAPTPTAVTPASSDVVEAPAALQVETPFNRGLLLARQGQHGLAAVQFLAAGKAEKQGRAYDFAAFSLSFGHDPKGAIVAADEAIRLGHRSASVYANRAYNHLQLGHSAPAKADSEAALSLDSTLVPPRYTRALACLNIFLETSTPVPPEVFADLAPITAAAPNDPEVWTTAAQLYALRSGEQAMRDHAADAVRQAIRSGKSAEVLKRNAVLKSLAVHQVFHSPLHSMPDSPAPRPNPHLVCPIP